MFLCPSALCNRSRPADLFAASVQLHRLLPPPPALSSAAPFSSQPSGPLSKDKLLCNFSSNLSNMPWIWKTSSFFLQHRVARILVQGKVA
ncbi:unnamed protein product [Victoria cruziana]